MEDSLPIPPHIQHLLWMKTSLWNGGETSEMQETRLIPALVPSLGQEDPLKKEMATHSSSLAWKIS